MKRLIFFLLVSFYAVSVYPQSITLNTWEVFEITLQARKKLSNPYVDGLREGEQPYLTASFTGISGEAAGKSYLIPGFWDGNNTWKVRFAPPDTGEWSYATNSSDKAMDNKKGKVIVASWTEDEKKSNPTRHGIIEVNDKGERKGRYFVYADNTPFLWVGDTWWNWAKKDIHFNSFKKLADTRAEQGFTVGQLFFAGNGWSEKSSLLDPTYRHPKIEQIQQVEKMIRYANEKGITVWIHAWWSRENIDDKIGAENMRRWWRYVVDRLQAYNVIWVLAGEYNMYNYGGFGLDFWNNLGNLVKSEDPYNRITSVHPTPPGWSGGTGAPQWSTAEVIHTENWLDYNQSQPGHGKWRNEMIPEIVSYAYHQNPPKPIVVTEPWYEFIEGNPPAMDIRFGAWSAILSGAAGHSYGGGHIWRTNVPESPEGVGSWPMDTSFRINTMLYKGAMSMSFLSHFLQKIQWWKLEPHPELVLENPSKYCAADPGREYLAYLRYGGTVKMDLRGTTEKQMHYEWIDLADQRIAREGNIYGGYIVSISPPEDYPGVPQYKDWLLHINSE